MTVEEVLVDVVVTQRNRPVAGLTAEDFVLLDGGTRRDIRLVPLEDLPVSVLFVMDMSESVTRGTAGASRGGGPAVLRPTLGPGTAAR